jgi:uncharacterized membrane protein
MQNPPPVQASKSSTGLDENVAALLSYIFTVITGLVFFLIEKSSRLVRFHAMQAILLGAVWIVLLIVLSIVSFVLTLIVGQFSGLLATLISLVLWLLYFVVWIALVIGWIFCLIKAYQGQYFKLPILGNFAEKFSAK